jgi:hypothetical protein
MKPDVRWDRAAARMVSLCLLAAVSASALAAGLIQDPPELQRRFAALVAGQYTGQACSRLGDPNGSGQRPAQLRINAAGQVMLGGVSMTMFGPGVEVGFGRRTGRDDALNFELREGELRHAMLSSTDQGAVQGFLEMGQSPGGQGNVTVGEMCADLDLANMPLRQAANPLLILLAEAYDTGGATVSGQCKNLGRKRDGKRVGGETRSATFSVGPQAIVLNGQVLPLHDAKRPVVSVDAGSRLADGTLNGSFDWADGANFHIEQFIGEARHVAVFSFSEQEAKWYCQPSR